jgi:hypothetical protein
MRSCEDLLRSRSLMDSSGSDVLYWLLVMDPRLRYLQLLEQLHPDLYGSYTCVQPGALIVNERFYQKWRKIDETH